MSEKALIQWLRSRIGDAPSAPVGPGDDAAVLRISKDSSLLITADAFLEGVHFAPDADPGGIGHKAIAAAVSDIAAMGCYPLHSFVTVGLNQARGDKFVRALSAAMITAAEKYGAPIAGGDVTSWAAPLAVSVTVVGETRNLAPVLRSGARAGDHIFVTGQLGGSLLGRHLWASPRIAEGLFLNREIGVHAMIDVSDGLSTDLGHIAEESGVGAIIDEAAIPVSDAARQLEARDGFSALHHALDDGEDFELLFTVAADRVSRLRETWPFEVPVTEIGKIGGDGVFIQRPDGTRYELVPGGYEHKWR